MSHGVEYYANKSRVEWVTDTVCWCTADIAAPGCVEMELGIAIPTPSNPADWSAVKRFVASVVSELEIGRQDGAVQVGVLTYRGQFTYLLTYLLFLYFSSSSYMNQ